MSSAKTHSKMDHGVTWMLAKKPCSICRGHGLVQKHSVAHKLSAEGDASTGDTHRRTREQQACAESSWCESCRMMSLLWHVSGTKKEGGEEEAKMKESERQKSDLKKSRSKKQTRSKRRARRRRREKKNEKEKKREETTR